MGVFQLSATANSPFRPEPRRKWIPRRRHIQHAAMPHRSLGRLRGERDFVFA